MMSDRTLHVANSCSLELELSVHSLGVSVRGSMAWWTGVDITPNSLSNSAGRGHKP